MKGAYSISIVAVIVVLVAGLVANNLFSADLSSPKTPPPVPDAAFAVSPFKGPADAPVKVVVFTCFQ